MTPRTDERRAALAALMLEGDYDKRRRMFILHNFSSLLLATHGFIDDNFQITRHGENFLRGELNHESET